LNLTKRQFLESVKNSTEIKTTLQTIDLNQGSVIGLFKASCNELTPNLKYEILGYLCQKYQSIGLYLELVSTCINLKYIKDAERYLKIIQKSIPIRKYLMLKTKILFHLDDYGEIISLKNSYQSDFQENSFLLKKLSLAYEKVGDFTSAIDSFDRLAALFSEEKGFSDLRKLKIQKARDFKWLNSFEFYEFMIKNGSSDELIIEYVKLLKKEGKFFEAIQFLDSKIKTMNSERLYFKLAKLYLAIHEYELCQKVYAAYRHKNDETLNLKCEMINYFIETNEYEKAEHLLAQMDGVHNSMALRKLRVNLFVAQRKYRQAVSETIFILKKNPSLVNYEFLCNVCIKCQKISLAKYYLRKYEEKFKSNYEVYEKLGMLYFKIKEYCESLRCFEKVNACSMISNYALPCYTRLLSIYGCTQDAFFSNLAYATCEYKFASKNLSKDALESLLIGLDQVKYLFESNVQVNREMGVDYLDELLSKKDRFKPYMNFDNFGLQVSRQLITNKIDSSMLSKETIENAISEINDFEIASGILWLASEALEEIERAHECFELLERALWIDKHSQVLLDRYKRLFLKRFKKIRFKENETALLLVSHQKNIQSARKNALGIFKHTNIKVITLLANENSNDYIIEKMEYGYELIVPCDDSYMGLAQKMIMAYRFLFISTNLSGLFKLDDDVIVYDFERFKNLVNSCKRQASGYVGFHRFYSSTILHHGRNKNKRFAEKALHRPCDFCDGGKGYYLSRNNLSYIFEDGLCVTSPHDGLFLEDVLIGEILDGRGIKLTSWAMDFRGGYSTDNFSAFPLLELKN